ncbi:MAG: PAS domain S-box protein [Planctomycetes bacterium]|nr:PAS domain S-box protein [Planctomycetota bacterium]
MSPTKPTYELLGNRLAEALKLIASLCAGESNVVRQDPRLLARLREARDLLLEARAQVDNEVKSHALELAAANEQLSREIEERRGTELALQESEHRFRALFARMSSGVAVYRALDGGSDFEIVDFNRAAEQIEKIERRRVIGKRVTEAFPGVVDFGLLDVLRRVFATGKPERHPIAFYQDSQHSGWRDNFVYRLPSGEVVAIYDDVTKRVLAEIGLRESESRFRAIFEQAGVGVAQIEAATGRFVRANQRYCDIVGLGPDEITATTFMAITHPNDLARDLELGQELLAGRIRSFAAEKRYVRRDGSIVWVDLSVSAMAKAGEAPEYCIAVAQDISARKQAEAALARSEALLRETQAIARAGGWEYDAVTRKVTWTEEVYKILGVARDFDASDPERALSFCAPESLPLVQDAFARALERAEPFDLEFELIRAGRERVWGRAVGRPVIREERVARIAGNLVDVTERRRAEAERADLEERLRHAQKMEAVGQLAGGVAHDFNNILTAILGSVELAAAALADDGGTARGVEDALHEIRLGAERAAALTRQLLAFSRRQISRPRLVDLGRTLGDMEMMLRRLLSENIALEVRRGPDLWQARVDPGQIEQVVMNLAVNARDAMPNGGRLVFETRNVTLDQDFVAARPELLPGPHVLLAVSDTGCGMDAKTLERAFEPFFTTKDVGRGTGLGLSTVYGIVRQSRGHIAVHSAPGQGTGFEIFLPADASVPGESVQARRVALPPTGIETILVCEDDLAVRDLTRRMLEGGGYNVLAASNAKEALEVAARHGAPIHLLLTDVIMPGMDGGKLASEMAARDPALKVLYISGYTADIVTHGGALDQGVEFLEKPFTWHRLLWRVREVLEKKPAAR